MSDAWSPGLAAFRPRSAPTEELRTLRHLAPCGRTPLGDLSKNPDIARASEHKKMLDFYMPTFGADFAENA